MDSAVAISLAITTVAFRWRGVQCAEAGVLAAQVVVLRARLGGRHYVCTLWFRRILKGVNRSGTAENDMSSVPPVLRKIN